MLNNKKARERFMGSKREYSFDRIRIIACLAVVGLHTFSKDLSFLVPV